MNLQHFIASSSIAMWGHIWDHLTQSLTIWDHFRLSPSSSAATRRGGGAVVLGEVGRGAGGVLTGLQHPHRLK